VPNHNIYNNSVLKKNPSDNSVDSIILSIYVTTFEDFLSDNT